MKILVAAPYIYNASFHEFTKNKTGFGMMVYDIFSILNKKNEAYLFTHVLTSGHSNSIMKHTLFHVLMSMKFKDVKLGLIRAIKYKQSFRDRIRYFYYCLNMGFFRRTIKEIVPDLVHIHGIGYSSIVFVEICQELNIPYVVTLHGLIGLNDSVSASVQDKNLERNFLVAATNNGTPVTVISSGIKKRIENSYLGCRADNIYVIPNGIELNKDVYTKKNQLNLRKEYNIPHDTKIGIVIGSICKRKNQIQIIKAIARLRDSVKDKLAVFFCGVDCLNGEMQDNIKECNLEGNIHLLGFLQREVILQLLDQVDINIVASYDEGFGLSIIEAFSRGVPTITFNDIDAVEDLYNNKCMLLASSRSTEDLMNAIEEGLSKKWDKQFIKNYSNKFSLDYIAEKYNQLFNLVKVQSEKY